MIKLVSVSYLTLQLLKSASLSNSGVAPEGSSDRKMSSSDTTATFSL